MVSYFRLITALPSVPFFGAAWAMSVANGPRWRLAFLLAGLSVCILAVALSMQVGALVELVSVPSNVGEYQAGNTNPSAWGYDETRDEAWAKMWPLCASGKNQVNSFSVTHVAKRTSELRYIAQASDGTD